MTKLLYNIIINLGRITQIINRLANIAAGESRSQRRTETVARIVNDYTDIITVITEDIAEINTFYNNSEVKNNEKIENKPQE